MPVRKLRDEWTKILRMPNDVETIIVRHFLCVEPQVVKRLGVPSKPFVPENTPFSALIAKLHLIALLKI